MGPCRVCRTPAMPARSACGTGARRASTDPRGPARRSWARPQALRRRRDENASLLRGERGLADGGLRRRGGPPPRLQAHADGARGGSDSRSALAEHVRRARVEPSPAPHRSGLSGDLQGSLNPGGPIRTAWAERDPHCCDPELAQPSHWRRRIPFDAPAGEGARQTRKSTVPSPKALWAPVRQIHAADRVHGGAFRAPRARRASLRDDLCKQHSRALDRGDNALALVDGERLLERRASWSVRAAGVPRRGGTSSHRAGRDYRSPRPPRPLRPRAATLARTRRAAPAPSPASRATALAEGHPPARLPARSAASTAPLLRSARPRRAPRRGPPPPSTTSRARQRPRARDSGPGWLRAPAGRPARARSATSKLRRVAPSGRTRAERVGGKRSPSPPPRRDREGVQQRWLSPPGPASCNACSARGWPSRPASAVERKAATPP